MEQALYESSPQVKVPHISAAILQLVVERRAWLPNMGENFLAILQSCSCDTVRPDSLPKENKFSHQPIFFDCEGAGRAKGASRGNFSLVLLRPTHILRSYL